VSIADDGRGIGPAPGGSDEGGFGLRSIAARTRLLGGRHHIETKAGGGTTITIEIPLGPSPDLHAS
jgi:signal transduction histidine kinase